MKVKISYDYDAKYDAERPYWATDGKMWCCGQNYDIAKQRLIAKLKVIAGVPPDPPLDEEVEI